MSVRKAIILEYRPRISFFEPFNMIFPNANCNYLYDLEVYRLITFHLKVRTSADVVGGHACQVQFPMLDQYSKARASMSTKATKRRY